MDLDTAMEQRLQAMYEENPDLQEAREAFAEYTQEVGQKIEETLMQIMVIPAVRVNREKFLRKILDGYCPQRVIDEAVQTSPADALVPDVVVEKLANKIIREETASLCTMSVATGIPGGWFTLLTIPGDLLQYYGHMLRLVQKLAYLYSWEEFQFVGGRPSEKTKSDMVMLTGVMYGSSDPAEAINTMSGAVTVKLQRKAKRKVKGKLKRKMEEKALSIPAVAKVSGFATEKVPLVQTYNKLKDSAIPYGKMTASGVVSYMAFRTMARRLKEFLKSLPQNRPERFYPEVYSRTGDQSE